MRAIYLCVSAALIALVIAASGASASSGKVVCPIKPSPSPPTTGDVQWTFTDSGRPHDPAVSLSYVHGRGTWTSGRSTGTGCTSDRRHGVVRNLVLSLTGKSKVSGRVTQGGLLGVRLLLPVKVLASDDKSCTKGATGTITLFASYYSVHQDTMQMHFSSHCTGHNLKYSGSLLHVYISRHGAQVNTP
jgi:hypothetical protein